MTMTLGEKLAGTNFNPSGDETVARVKRLMADALDVALAIKAGQPGHADEGDPAENALRQAIATDAILHLQTAQMQLVKLATWR